MMTGDSSRPRISSGTSGGAVLTRTNRPLPMRADGLLPKTDTPLTLLDGPERIETGWWDDFDVKRDYFVARDGSGAKLWLFRQRTGRKDWFLHGIFS